MPPHELAQLGSSLVIKRTLTVITAALAFGALSGGAAFAAPADDKELCKNNGYVKYIDPTTDAPFKNQGSCITFVNGGGVLQTVPVEEPPAAQRIIEYIPPTTDTGNGFQGVFYLNGYTPGEVVHVHLWLGSQMFDWGTTVIGEDGKSREFTTFDVCNAAAQYVTATRTDGSVVRFDVPRLTAECTPPDPATVAPLVFDPIYIQSGQMGIPHACDVFFSGTGTPRAYYEFGVRWNDGPPTEGWAGTRVYDTADSSGRVGFVATVPIGTELSLVDKDGVEVVSQVITCYDPNPAP
jgi:hypothetical protein